MTCALVSAKPPGVIALEDRRGHGTGVAFTRDPASGANVFYGEFLMNAQGEDVVAGRAIVGTSP